MYKRFNETPTYTADTYTAIVYGLVPTIEAVGSLGCRQNRGPPGKPRVFDPGREGKIFKGCPG